MSLPILEMQSLELAQSLGSTLYDPLELKLDEDLLSSADHRIQFRCFRQAVPR